MEYTSNYQLPVWAETDRILRTDFNEAYQKLDAVLKTNADTTAANTSAIASKGNCMVISGSYTGTGGVGSAAPNSLSFDKKPLAILILPANGSGGYPQNMTLLRGANVSCTIPHQANSGNAVAWGENSVSWYAYLNDPSIQFNQSGGIYCYVVFLIDG